MSTKAVGKTKIEIKHRWTQEVLHASHAADLRAAVTEAVFVGSDLSGSDLSGSDLRRSDLRRSDLSGSDLSGSDLSGSDLSGSDLSGSDLSGSDLSGSDLRGSDLRRSDLRRSKINWNSHALIAELLRREAGDDVEKRKVAGLVAISTDWCWGNWRSLASDPLFGWAVDALAPFAKEGDNAPGFIRDRAAELAKAVATP